MRVALDTNILVYAEGLNGPVRQTEARAIIAGLGEGQALIPVQALGELLHVLTRKARWDGRVAQVAIAGWSRAHPVIATTPDVLTDAMELVVAHRFTVWDAVILAAAAKAGCRALLSEDMHHGFTWRGVTVRNPFATPATPTSASH